MIRAIEELRLQSNNRRRYKLESSNKYCPECKGTKHVSAFYAGDSWCRQCKRHHSNEIWNGETPIKRTKLSYKDRKQIEQDETIAIKEKVQKMHVFITQTLANDNAELSVVNKRQKRKQELVRHGDYWVWI